MNELLTYYNINWEKYLPLFNIYDNVQGIFFIPNTEISKCLNIGIINNPLNLKIYDITFSKIKRINNLGPFITFKKYTKNFTDNIEEGMVEFFKDHKYYKWIGIIDESLDKSLYSVNLFNNYIDIPNILTYIIPFRNRHENLDETINGLKNYIQYQNLEADIWVIEQNQFGNWNKGMTCNCGFDILKDYYQYFVFNDADTYSKLNNKFIYPSKNEINHIYGYDYCLGGIFSCDKDTFIKINGFNNNFFNWGREDRDLEDRCVEHNVNINRNNLIKLNHNNKVKQLEHDNVNNYWNFKEENKEFYQARELYYLNQIQHMKKEFDNGLSSLVSDSSVENNRKVMILINLKKWTQGVITILSLNKELFKINVFPELDTGLIKIKYNDEEIDLPINPKEKYPKIQLVMHIDNNYLNVSIKYNYLFEQDFRISNITSNNYDIDYKNIELDFDNIYTPFNNNVSIKYNYYPIYHRDYYLLKIIY